MLRVDLCLRPVADNSDTICVTVARDSEVRCSGYL